MGLMILQVKLFQYFAESAAVCCRQFCDFVYEFKIRKSEPLVLEDHISLKNLTLSSKYFFCSNFEIKRVVGLLFLLLRLHSFPCFFP